MPRYNFDLSEYQQPEFEFPWEGCSDLSPTHLPNYVSYFSETKTLHISVEGPQEYDSMLLLYESKGYPTPAVYLTTPTEDEVNSWHDTYQQIREKFGTAFQVKQPFLPFGSISERRVNAFSGTEINLPLGEGILNFCYADFNSAFEHCLPAYQKLMQVPDPPAKIQSAEEGVIHLFELYVKVFPALSEVFYSSLYTSVFLPQFTRATELAWEYYRRYLLLLQEELLELIEFCFDKEYRPDVLERLYPSERYSLWCSINGVSSDHIRQEIFHAGTYAPDGIQMPFGTDMEEVQRNLEKEFHLTPEQRAFAEENALSEEELWFRYQCPCFASTSYSCDNLRDMLYLEFTKILETGVEFQKCKRCGKYFIAKGNYHGSYCDRIPEGEHRTCQQLAAQEAYLKKLKNNGGENPLNVYQKYYKRYFARMKAGSLKEKKFKQWQYDAVQKRDDCLNGEITLDEFKDWLEASMPNRKKRA